MISKNKILISVQKDKIFNKAEKLTPLPIKIAKNAKRRDFEYNFLNTMCELGYFKHVGFDDCITINNIIAYFGDKCRIKNKTVLCANTKVYKTHMPWIYFPKCYSKYLNIYKKLIKNDKIYNTCWIGGGYKRSRRKNFYLVKYCDFNFNSHRRQLNYEEYLMTTSHSKFCLCLPGFGSKCHREIEAIGLGVVPAITEGVSTDYYNKLIENVHYIKIRHEKDLLSLKNFPDDKYQYMSQQCSKWFEENISPLGAYNVTKELTNKLLSKND